MKSNEMTKMHRAPFEYGIYDLVEELKVKERVKPNMKEDMSKTINSVLGLATSEGFGKPNKPKDRVYDMLAEEDIHKKEAWSEMGPMLHEAISIKAYEEEWVRGALVKYVKDTTEKDLTVKEDKVILQELFHYLDKLEEVDREGQLEKLERALHLAQKSYENKKVIEGLDAHKKTQNYYNKEKKLMENELTERVIEFMRIEKQIRDGESHKKLSRRDFINETFAQLMKSHPETLVKYFNPVKGDT